MSHDHASDISAAGRHMKPLATAFVLVAVFMVVEVVAGFATGSLALLSDAGHMATDTLGLGMALAAVTAAQRTAATGSRTYGLYRLEILAALANAVLLFLVAGYVVWEAVQRFQDPPEVATGAMFFVGLVGLGVNVAAWRLLRAGAASSLNLEGAMLEVIADLIGSIGVIVAALLDRFAGWPQADAVFAAAIGLFILPRAYRIGRRAVRILIQAAPDDLDLDELPGRLRSIPGVVDVHDVHVWTLTSEMDIGSVHLMIGDGTDAHPVLDEARSMLTDDFGIAHATLQVEPESHRGCTELSY